MRIGFLLLFLFVLAAASYDVIRVERAIRNGQTAWQAYDDMAREITRSVLELRGAQQAYVAAGQAHDYWIPRAASQIRLATADLSALRGLSADRDGEAALDQAADAVARFAEMDGRARDYATNGQQLMASNLIFSDGLELTTTAIDAIGTARERERARREDTRRRQRLRQSAAITVAAGTGFVCMLLLLPVAPAPVRTIANAASTSLMIDDGSQPGRVGVAAGDVAGETRIERIEPPPAPDGAPSPGRIAIDLQATAVLCTDLGRVSDSAELPSLLKRAADLIEASGVVLWLGDPAGTRLHPALAHGYSPHALDQLGEISSDGDNATATAFRTGRIQIVGTRENSHGALVVPLLTTGGCVGVMAAELAHGREATTLTRAVASIVAAQLAMLVAGPPPAGATEARSELA